MKKYFYFSTFLLVVFLSACGQSSGVKSKTSLDANAFAKAIQENANATILDVRTTDEFAGGHLQNAINMDWNSNEFDQQVATLDKAKPLFVYCLSGGRSSAAAKHLRSSGYTRVYELEGGMMQWRAAHLPETTNTSVVSKGMSMKDFEALLNTNKMVLFDFNAEWCGPCKKMKPFMDELTTKLADQVTIISIDADKNVELCEALHVDGLPTLMLYKNKNLTWSNKGFISKEDLLKHLK